MRRFVLVLLCGLLVLQLGCSRSSDVSEDEMAQPIRFYYCAAGEENYNRETGALNWEWRDLGNKTLSTMEVLELYLKGPVSSELKSPFPKNAEVKSASRQGGLLKLELGTEIGQLTGVEQTMAAACLVYTMMQLEGVETLWLEYAGGAQQGCWNKALKQGSFVLSDATGEIEQQYVTLYFTNAGCRFLVPENRESNVDTVEELPAFLMEQLLLGPQKEGGYAILPVQLEFLGIEVKDGICTLNLSSEFLTKKPQTHREARMAVFSIVNTLTQLPEISSVRFLCAGVPVTEYVGLTMDEPLEREETAVEMESEEPTFDATLFLPCSERAPLVAVPVKVREVSGKEHCEGVLDALLTFETVNGYVNPIPEGTGVSGVTLEDGLCSVTFDKTFALCDQDPEQAEQAVCAVVCTLCHLKEVEQVKIQIRNGGLTTIDLSKPFTADAGWYMQ